MSHGLGSVMLDLEGSEISAAELELLKHPQTGGVILFSRNFSSIKQLKNLCEQIHKLRTPPLLIAVDHEGGRVQRFKDGFSKIPAMAKIGKIYDDNPRLALEYSHSLAWLMASELRQVGVDFSFAPILDIDAGISQVIGNRAFHNTAAGVSAMAAAWVNGMHAAGMAAVGKHFPGHGSVATDSHTDIPFDDRTMEQIEAYDLIPFQTINNLDGIMPAHVIYTQIDDKPAGFSQFWLQEILRQKLGFSGIIFSDDLNMQAANVAGDFTTRARIALAAGCDMILVCNNSKAVAEVLTSLADAPLSNKLSDKLGEMRAGVASEDLSQLAKEALLMVGA